MHVQACVRALRHTCLPRACGWACRAAPSAASGNTRGREAWQGRGGAGEARGGAGLPDEPLPLRPSHPPPLWCGRCRRRPRLRGRTSPRRELPCTGSCILVPCICRQLRCRLRAAACCGDNQIITAPCRKQPARRDRRAQLRAAGGDQQPRRPGGRRSQLWRALPLLPTAQGRGRRRQARAGAGRRASAADAWRGLQSACMSLQESTTRAWRSACRLQSAARLAGCAGARGHRRICTACAACLARRAARRSCARRRARA